MFGQTKGGRPKTQGALRDSFGDVVFLAVQSFASCAAIQLQKSFYNASGHLVEGGSLAFTDYCRAIGADEMRHGKVALSTVHT